MIRTAADYLTALCKASHLPNFWCSQEYFERAGWIVKEVDGFIGVFDKDGKKMLPEIQLIPFVLLDYSDSWAGFSSIPAFWGGDELDYEFIYDPQSFLDLSGSPWRMVRKNLRWAESDLGEKVFLDSSPIVTTTTEQEIMDFIVGWTEGNNEKEFYDPEVMVEYLLKGKNRFFVRGVSSKSLYGILAYDYNWKYVNFRYCTVLGGVRGLSDTARVLFYQKIAKTFPGFQVNDGGSLGNDGLYRYKLRLNPIKVSKIRTYCKYDERGIRE